MCSGATERHGTISATTRPLGLSGFTAKRYETNHAKGNEMADGFTAWAHLEAMGHRGHWGLVSEVQIAGASFLQVEIFKLIPPDGTDERLSVSLYPPASIYCITPHTEERCRLMSTPYGERPAAAELEAPKPWDGLNVDVDDDDEYVDA